MRGEELFHIRVNGEQRGPYSVRHIDHLLNSGLITEDALFWREGMEQWELVTGLVGVRRVKVRSWRGWLVAGAVAMVLAVVGNFFGPITIEGWRESSRRDFSPQAAYWRARGAVREQALPGGTAVAFERVQEARVTLAEGKSARVLLRGEVPAAVGGWRRAMWLVELEHGGEIAGWRVVGVREIDAE